VTTSNQPNSATEKKAEGNTKEGHDFTTEKEAEGNIIAVYARKSFEHLIVSGIVEIIKEILYQAFQRLHFK
jgi:hypothetical protein